MAQSMQLLESIDSGSNYKFAQKMFAPNAPRSMFDYTRLVTTTIAEAGRVQILDLFETLPASDYELSVDALVRVLPQVVPLYSRQRLYIYAFYNRISDLWNGSEVFLTKGYSGNVIKKIPILDDSKNIEFSNNATVTPDSPADGFGFPIGASMSSLFGSQSNACINALPIMMLLRIYRDYFMNKNHHLNDRVILPDDDTRFRLNDSGELLSAKDEGVDFKFNLSDWNGYTYNETESQGVITKTARFSGFFHDYPMDYFQSALPFTQRGDEPVLPVNGSINWKDVVSPKDQTDNIPIGLNSKGLAELINGRTGTQYLFTNTVGELLKGTSTSDYTAMKSAEPTGLLDVLNKATVDSYSITLNKIRELAIKQTELEKMARTDGSYAQFGLTFFGERSKNALDYRSVYIGGCYKNISFTEVLQTSGSSVGTTDPQNSSPLGAYAGHGITGIQNGYIGKVHSDDYGYIMILCCIMPDIYYSQGIEKMWTRSLQSDMYLPERAKLGMVPILNKELFYAGNNGNEQGQDNYLWAYQDPFDELRYRPNVIKGKIADPNSLSFFPYTQSRKFTQLPNWGESFAHASDVRKDSFFSAQEDGYTGQFKINCRAVLPLPYRAIPAKII